MRLFTALDISAETRAALVALAGELAPGTGFGWSRAENLHITTKFIGEWPGERLGELREALAGIGRPGEIAVEISGLGWFPNPHSPRFLFAGVRAGEELGRLHRATDAACAGLGIAGETKEFRAHLTLARMKGGEGLAEVRGRIARLETTAFGRFLAGSFGLYESLPGVGGSQYKKLEEFPLR
jgi:2'-5' RNA ligase